MFLGSGRIVRCIGFCNPPDYSIVDRSASDVPTFRDEVFTRPLLDYYPQTGVNGISLIISTAMAFLMVMGNPGFRLAFAIPPSLPLDV